MRRLAARARTRSRQQFAIGLKELWEVPRGSPRSRARSIHTLGYPLRHEEFGGAFIYAMPDGPLSLGFVVGLDYTDPLFDPHMAFNRFKQHPFVAALLDGGQMVRYGAKALPEGGWNTIPRAYMDGGLIAGDAGELPELDAAQGHPPGDADRHAGGRDGVRGGARRRHVGGGAEARTRTRSTPAPIRDRAVSGAQRPPGVRPRPARRAWRSSGVALADAGTAGSTTCTATPGHERMKTLAWYYGLDKSAARGRATPRRSIAS